MKRIDIFLSYCRDDSSEADKIYNYFKSSQNIELHRDTIDIKNWGSIKEYMQSIRDMDYTIILISDTYLKSANCMYEILEVMRDRSYKGKIFPAVICSEIYRPITRAKYVKYWQDEFRELENTLKEIHMQNLGNLSGDLKRIQDISSNIAEFLDIVSDMNNPNVEDVCIRIEEKLKIKKLISNEHVENKTVKQDKRIIVIGVGGGGNNSVNRMIEEGLGMVEFICINTDEKHLSKCKTNTCIQIGKKLTKGLGTRNRPEVGRAAAEESRGEITELVKGADMVFVTCGMGGGTGTGAAPVVAEISKELGILTVGIVTKPFTFEAERRINNAIYGIETLRESVDTLIVIPNDRLLQIIDKRTSMPDALGKTDEILIHILRGIIDIIRVDGSIKIKFEDIQIVLKNRGIAYIGSGVGKGSDNVREAVAKAIKNPLLDVSIDGAKFAIIMVTGDVSVKKANDAVAYLQEYIRNEVKIYINVICTKDNSSVCNVAIIATGIEDEENPVDICGVKYTTATSLQRNTSGIEESIRIPSFLRRK